MTPLVYLLFLGGKGRDKNGNEITPENAKNLSLFGKLKFSLYNMIVFRKFYDKEKFVGKDEKNSSLKIVGRVKKFKLLHRDFKHEKQ